MTKIVNKHSSPIGLPNINVEIPKGGSVRLDKTQWDKIASNEVVKQWMRAGVILVEGHEEMEEKGGSVKPMDYGKMKVADLKEMASAREIELDDDAKKADIVEALEAWDKDNA